MRIFRRSRDDRPPADVLARLPRGERVLAAAESEGRWVIGTRDALVIAGPEIGPEIGPETDPGVVRLPWEQVQDAEWDREGSVLRVTGVGEYGRPRPSYVFTLADPRLLLQLIRERVTASIVLQRGVLLDGERGFKVIGRRPPSGGPVVWMHEYDEGVDPGDPAVAALAEEALAAARAEVGE